jgi:hypothetical protein
MHCSTAVHLAVACAFDLLMVTDDVYGGSHCVSARLALAKLLLRSPDSIQYVEHAERSWRSNVRRGLQARP